MLSAHFQIFRTVIRCLTLLLLAVFSHTLLNAQLYGTLIAGWDFADGIPADWENQSTSGIGVWEYRGPETTPGNTQGSQGSCGGNSVPLPSPSAANGFVMFDANFWDDPIGPCGNLGSGPDPGPHTAWLTTNSIDLTGEDAIVFTFFQQFNHFNTTTRVLISTNGGDSWAPILTNPTNANSNSGPGIWSTTNISAQAANQADVRFKFEFSGIYYWWMIDDIMLYKPNQNDLLIESPKYTLYSGTIEPDGLGRMEYSAYPQVMVPPFNFSGRIRNIGSNPQTEVRLNMQVQNPVGTTIYNQNSNPVEVLNSGAIQTFSIGAPFNPPNTLGNYTLRFQATQDETEQAPDDNLAFKHYRVTPYAYAFDRGDDVEDVFIPPALYQGQPYEIGGLYEARQTGLKLHGVGVSLAGATQPGSAIYAIAYNHRRDTVLATSEPYIVNEWDINEIGDEKLIHLTFTDPVITMNDSVYAVLVGSTDVENGLFYVGRNGTSFAQGSIVRFPQANALFFMLRAPIVRAHLFPGSSMPGCLDSESMNFNANADTDDGSCRYPGCINPQASNFDPSANFSTDSCVFEGCTDSEAANFNPIANVDDGSCLFPGCTDDEALNYNPNANVDDGMCVYGQAFLTLTDSVGCAPFTVNFVNMTALEEGSTCVFELDNEPFLEGCVANFELTFDEPGYYFVTYFYSVLDVNTSYTAGPIVVGETPEQPSLDHATGSNLITCQGCDAYDLTWLFNGMTLVGDGESSLEATQSGWYEVSISTDLGCTVMSEPIFVVLSEAVASISLSENEGCAPLQIAVTNLTQYEPTSTCTLVLNGEQLSATCFDTFDLTLEAGPFTVTFSHTVSDSTTTFTIEGLVFETPEQPLLDFDNDTLTLSCLNCDDSELNWYLNDQPIPGVNASSWEPEENGMYMVEVANGDGCISASAPILVVVTSVGEITVSDVLIYPNPATDQIRVRAGTLIDHIRMFTAEGHLVAEFKHPGGEPEINVNHLAPGIYLLTIERNGQTSRHRVSVVR